MPNKNIPLQNTLAVSGEEWIEIGGKTRRTATEVRRGVCEGSHRDLVRSRAALLKIHSKKGYHGYRTPAEVFAKSGGVALTGWSRAQYLVDIKQIIIFVQTKTHIAVNSARVEAYWLIGKTIIEEEQYGKNRAEYGKKIIKNFSTELRADYGAGFAERCLREYCQFYLTFKDWI